MPTYYLGLDVHKVRTQYCLMDPCGEILSEGSIPTEEAATLVPDVDTAIVLEATGSWHAAYDALVLTGAAVKLAHPARIKAIASAKVKTDKIDARILTHLLRADLIPEAWAPPAQVRELRDLVRFAGASYPSAPPPRTVSATYWLARTGAFLEPISSEGVAGSGWRRSSCRRTPEVSSRYCSSPSKKPTPTWPPLPPGCMSCSTGTLTCACS